MAGVVAAVLVRRVPGLELGRLLEPATVLVRVRSYSAAGSR